MSKEHLIEAITENTTIENATQFTREQLEDVREDLKAKREGLLVAKDKATNGNAIALLNLELGKIKTLLSAINQAISMIDVNAKQQKQKSKEVLKGGFAQRFLIVAEKELDQATFTKLKNKALKVA